MSVNPSPVIGTGIRSVTCSIMIVINLFSSVVARVATCADGDGGLRIDRASGRVNVTHDRVGVVPAVETF